jgi:N-dimethylarginine dimethylaminohydrolase
MRPGAPTRLGEAAEMAPHLRALYTTVERIEGPGTIEGGDILVTGREILVGQSARTDAAGIAELRAIVTAWGHALREVHTPPGVLHFKTDCSLLDADTILSTERLSASGCFRRLPPHPHRPGRRGRRQHHPLQRCRADARRLPRHKGADRIRRLHRGRNRQFRMCQA